ncbi:AAA family ATPase [Streptomyces sp. CA-251387]|uniref:AAA family ATPase n=1 Tax=Streptomyces sp. CA-251387 TaxID=3240064 RepID=UPI003D928BB7
MAMYVETAVTLTPEALALPARVPRTVKLPDRAGGLFVGRERELRLLDEAFEQVGGVVVHAVHGLGGVGRSTLAAHWAGRRTAEFNPVWWITAGSRQDLDAALAELARALHTVLAGTLAEEALREEALRCLSAHEGWLLVLDNVPTRPTSDGCGTGHRTAAFSSPPDTAGRVGAASPACWTSTSSESTNPSGCSRRSTTVHPTAWRSCAPNSADRPSPWTRPRRTAGRRRSRRGRIWSGSRPTRGGSSRRRRRAGTRSGRSPGSGG